MTSKLLVGFFLLLISVFSPLAAQTPTVDMSDEEKERAQKELESKALVILNDVVIGASSLKLLENRITIQVQAADLLWSRDEKRARALFRDAAAGLTALMAERQTLIRQGSPYAWVSFNLRISLIQMVAFRDPQFAMDLLHSTKPPQPEQTSSGRRGAPRDPEERLEQMIAAQIARKDPKAALQMAQESLKKGVSMTTLGMLRQLQLQDASAASSLVGDIVRQLQSQSLAAGGESAMAAIELFRSLVRPQTPQAAQTPGGAAIVWTTSTSLKPLTVDESVLRDLAVVIANVGVGAGPRNMRVTSQLQSLLPEIEKRAPQQAAQLKQRVSEANKAMDPDMKAWTDFQTALSSGSVDQMLALAAKAPQQSRDSMYSMAARQVAGTGDVDRARTIATENISVAEREQTLSQIERIASTRAADSGNLDAAKQSISAIQSREKRAEALAALAVQLAAKGDKAGALKLIDEAQGMVSRRPENSDEVTVLVQIATALTTTDPERAFDMIEPLIDLSNELMAASALVEKYNANPVPVPGSFKNGELLLQNGLNRGNLGYLSLIQPLTTLAKTDIDRTKTLADRFQRDEVRQYIRLMIAQSILSDRGGMPQFGPMAVGTVGGAFVTTIMN